MTQTKSHKTMHLGCFQAFISKICEMGNGQTGREEGGGIISKGRLQESTKQIELKRMNNRINKQ